MQQKQIKTYWDSFESPYQMGAQKHRVFLLDLLKEKGVESILDVGCGTGPIWGMIKESKERGEDKWDFTYLGTDYAHGMIDVCKKQFPDIHWQVEDARNLSLNDNSWDCVLLMHCLDHLDDYKAAISEAARVASKYVLIVLWRPFIDGPENKLNDRSTYGKPEGDNEPWDDTHFQEYSRDRLLEAFEQSGLTIEEEVNDDRINDDGRYNCLFLLKK